MGLLTTIFTKLSASIAATHLVRDLDERRKCSFTA